VAVVVAASAVLFAAGSVVDETADAVITKVPYPVVRVPILGRPTGNPIGVFCALGRIPGMSDFSGSMGAAGCGQNPERACCR
jgi:hypothetical protein